MSDLINVLPNHVKELDKLDGFISKTKEKSGKFSETVIARLVIEFEMKQDMVKEEASPIAEQLHERMADLRSDLEQLKSSNSGNDEIKQELDLRLEIGAISQKDYNAQIKDIQSSMMGYENELQSIESELNSVESVLNDWMKFSELSSSEDNVLDQPEVPEDVEEELPPPPSLLNDSSFDDDVLSSDVDEVIPEPDNVFDSSPYGTLDVGDDINFDLSDDNFGFEDSVEFSAELVAPDEFSSNIELNSVEANDENIAESDEPRSAILLRDEGTSNEVVHPVQGEDFTIGRAAENNIQIKNDSKVSRKHCKLTRRSNQFYIQDLSSSNGTVVDGELIDEKRLLGGEEIKVGETVFRFSIQ